MRARRAPQSSKVAAHPLRRRADPQPLCLRARRAIARGDRFPMPEVRGLACRKALPARRLPLPGARRPRYGAATAGARWGMRAAAEDDCIHSLHAEVGLWRTIFRVPRHRGRAKSAGSRCRNTHPVPRRRPPVQAPVPRYGTAGGGLLNNARCHPATSASRHYIPNRSPFPETG